MTIFELAETLPNGFHDAEVTTISLDYRHRTIVMQMEIWIGTMDDPEEIRETYRRAEVTIGGFHYCALDVPDEGYPFEDGTLTIDLAEATAFESRGSNFTCRFWVGEWNRFIHLSAEAASLRWLDEPINRGHPQAAGSRQGR